MDKFDYAGLREDKIIPLIKKFGTDVTLRRIEDTDRFIREYSPTDMRFYWLDTVTGDINFDKPDPVNQSYIGLCLNTRYRSEDVDGTNIKVGDRRLLVLNIPEPAIGEILTVDGTDYSVVRSDKVAPGPTTLFFRIQVRI